MLSLSTSNAEAIKGKRIIVRVDLNVPVQDGKILDYTRIERILPDIRLLLSCQAKVILISHFGRPRGRFVDDLSLEFLAKILTQKLRQPVCFSSNCIGETAQQAVHNMEWGDILLLENLRFHAGEETNDLEFAQSLAALGDLYVNDAFSVSHRAHASVEAITRYLPAYAGGAFSKEVHALTAATETPKHPVIGIVGGSKISTKIAVLRNLIEKLDVLVLGGGIAHTFLQAEGFNIGRSICEPDQLDVARETIARAKEKRITIYLPEDAIVVDDFETFSGNKVRDIDAIQSNEIILDIGHKTIEKITYFLNQCATVLWNGPLGLFEHSPYDQGTLSVARVVAQLTTAGKIFSVAGGGETVAALNRAQCADKLSYVSTAGGAFLEFLEGKCLPGVMALE